MLEAIIDLQHFILDISARKFFPAPFILLSCRDITFYISLTTACLYSALNIDRLSLKNKLTEVKS